MVSVVVSVFSVDCVSVPETVEAVFSVPSTTEPEAVAVSSETVVVTVVAEVFCEDLEVSSVSVVVAVDSDGSVVRYGFGGIGTSCAIIFKIVMQSSPLIFLSAFKGLSKS